LKARDLRFLCCPRCKGSLSLGPTSVAATEEILESSLFCENCPGRYPIIQGVPTFSTEFGATEIEQKTVAAFGFQWSRFRKQEGFSSSEELFDLFLPEGTVFDGKLALEAGCGTGRWIPHAVQRGARFVVGVDLSEAAYVAYENTRHYPNVLIIRASIASLPLRDKFDLIYSIGVIHHLPDPKKGIEVLSQALDSRGSLAVWVYSREGNEPYLALDPLRRAIAWWPNPLKLALSYPMGVFLRAILPIWSASRLPMAKYAQMLRKLSYRDLVNVINDQLAPSIAHYLTRAQVESWQENTGLRIDSLSMRTENSWKVLLRKA
jgi:SAM-dependent methyltransferase/uncharacterized protein YbaR (Trm112 family)